MRAVLQVKEGGKKERGQAEGPRLRVKMLAGACASSRATRHAMQEGQ